MRVGSNGYRALNWQTTWGQVLSDRAEALKRQYHDYQQRPQMCEPRFDRPKEGKYLEGGERCMQDNQTNPGPSRIPKCYGLHTSNRCCSAGRIILQPHVDHLSWNIRPREQQGMMYIEIFWKNWREGENGQNLIWNNSYMLNAQAAGCEGLIRNEVCQSLLCFFVCLSIFRLWTSSSISSILNLPGMWNLECEKAPCIPKTSRSSRLHFRSTNTRYSKMGGGSSIYFV